MARRTATAKMSRPHGPWIDRCDAIFCIDDAYIEPLSERWRQARRGRLTASERAIMIAERHPPVWNRLMDELNRELAPDYQWEELSNIPALEWGRRHEPEAIANIILSEGQEMIEPGLIFHKKYPFVAATPDGLMSGAEHWLPDNNGCSYDAISVQIKCPYNSKNHLETLYRKTIKPIYWWQTQWEAWVSEASDIRFYSYDPRQPPATQLVRLDIPVDKGAQKTMETNVQEFATLFSSGKRLAEGKISAIGIPDF